MEKIGIGGIMQLMKANRIGELSPGTIHITDTSDIIKWVSKNLDIDKVIMGTGFGPPGIALMDMLLKITRSIKIFYIDTGFLFQQTYDLKNGLEDHFKMEFIRLSTGLNPIEQEQKYTKELWNENPDLCCDLRKVQPLKDALSSFDYWITGIRKYQTATRSQASILEYEPRFNVIKLNPLLNWSHEQVWSYIRENKLPYNPMHDNNYPSIGCMQCTSPVSPGEDERSGRWNGKKKTECGLHKPLPVSLNEKLNDHE